MGILTRELYLLCLFTELSFSWWQLMVVLPPAQKQETRDPVFSTDSCLALSSLLSHSASLNEGGSWEQELSTLPPSG